jgi:S1-C subfamily serine protease
MPKHVYGVVALLAAFYTLGLSASAEDSLANIVNRQKPNTITVALDFSKKNMNPVMRLLSAAFDANGHATGFLVGEGLAMTSYHVVSGKLDPRKKQMLGFKPDEALDVDVYVEGCQAKVVKVDQAADLALLRVCASRQGRQLSFRNSADKNEPLFLIAQPGRQKTVRRGVFDGAVTVGSSAYLSMKVDGQDGFSGSPVYDGNGEIIGIFSRYDWSRGVALLSPATRAQRFLAEYQP